MKKLSALIFTGLTLGTAFSVQAETRVIIDTNMGKIELALDEKKTGNRSQFYCLCKQRFFSTALSMAS
ncbi:hypothetical protein IR141_11415 [Neisseria sp. 19428wB4_WF04]|uniref:Peptidyl-prolyl cis-trans isomerase n=1 Tax=Neisseria musculi TaxID=1815583 RepID=A0A7H1MA86_9NEIS|nr:hypothetical protein [Neisseria sp. 19428wB4_WF04]QNT58551.1 putative peptidyl-prolyl cis-trans isomerase [Neisseria musculi]